MYLNILQSKILRRGAAVRPELRFHAGDKSEQFSNGGHERINVQVNMVTEYTC